MFWIWSWNEEGYVHQGPALLGFSNDETYRANLFMWHRVCGILMQSCLRSYLSVDMWMHISCVAAYAPVPLEERDWDWTKMTQKGGIPSV